MKALVCDRLSFFTPKRACCSFLQGRGLALIPPALQSLFLPRTPSQQVQRLGDFVRYVLFWMWTFSTNIVGYTVGFYPIVIRWAVYDALASSEFLLYHALSHLHPQPKGRGFDGFLIRKRREWDSNPR